MPTGPTRGEFNHNPLNINFMARRPWNGQVGIEAVMPGHSYTPRFGRYVDDFHGIRASFKQLILDNTVHGLKTITALISDPTYGWAPAADRNDDATYIETVVQHSGIPADQEIDLTHLPTAIAVWPGFCIEENGRNPYNAALIEAAARDALGLTEAQTKS